MKYIILSICLFVGLLYVSCEKEVIAPLSFESDIQPLLTKCASPYCHGNGNYAGSVKSYKDVVNFVNTGRVLPALNHETGFSPMPKGQEKWSNEDISKLESWISQGMPK